MALRNRTARLRPALAPVTLAMLTACLMAPAAPASAGDVNFNHGKQVGLATVVNEDGSKRPIEFVVDNDGHLWEFERSGSFWTKTDRGTPVKVNGDPVVIVAGAGAVGVDQGVRAYIVGDDGNLWEFKHDGGSGAWAKIARPQESGKLRGALGVDVNGDGARFVVARDEHDRLWQYTYAKGRWDKDDMGTMPDPGNDGERLESDAGLGTFRGGAYAFTISNRNVLWSVHRTVDDKWTWISWGTPIRGADPVWTSLGVISYRAQNELHAFIQSDDRTVWRVSWDEARGSGAWQPFGTQAPSLDEYAGGGATAIPGGEQVTALGRDGKLRNTVNGHLPSTPWYGTQSPSVTMVKELGSRNVANDSYTFTVDRDGDVWAARFSPSDVSWKWTEIHD